MRVPRRRVWLAGVWAACAVAACQARAAQPSKTLFRWTRLPDVPTATLANAVGGIEDAYAGGQGEGLIVAGGLRRTRGESSAGTQRLRDVYVLIAGTSGASGRTEEGKDAPGDKYRWQFAGRLPAARSGGAAVPVAKGLLCLGGQVGPAGKATDAATLLAWQAGQAEVRVVALPPLPRPTSRCAAAVLDDTLCVLAPSAGPDVPAALWTLGLKWKELEATDATLRPKWKALPAPIREIDAAAMAAQGGWSGGEALYVVVRPGPSGAAPQAWRGSAKGKWTRLADPPRDIDVRDLFPVGSAHVVARGHLYHTITDTWIPADLGWPKPAHPRAGGALYVGLWKDDPVVLAGLPGGGGGSQAYRLALRNQRTGFGAANWAALIGYLVLMIGIGVYFSKREKSTDDFFLAGRRIPWWAAGISIFGTSLSAITFMAIPAKAFRTNWVYAIQNFLPILLVPLVILCYIPFYRRLQVKTAYEYLEERFHVVVRLFGSLQFVLFQIGRMAIILFLPAMAMSTVTGMSVYGCIVLMGVLCTAYTVLGGIEAVIWTDVLQVFILMGAALMSLVLIAGSTDGGFAGVIQTGMADGKLQFIDLNWDIAAAGLWVIVVGQLFALLLPLTADQTVVQRYLATTDEKSARKALWTHALAGVPATLLFFGLGTALYVYYKGHPAQLDPGVAADSIYPLYVVQQIPAPLAGLVIAGLFAAAMSSIDSSMNSIASAVVNDYVLRINKNVSDRTCLWLARGITVLLGVLGTLAAVAIAYLELKQLWDQYLKIFGLLGGGLAALFAMGIFTRRIHGLGAMVGAVASAALLSWIAFFDGWKVSHLLYGAIGFCSCFAVAYLVSWAIPLKQKNLGGLVVYRMIQEKKE